MLERQAHVQAGAGKHRLCGSIDLEIVRLLLHSTANLTPTQLKQALEQVLCWYADSVTTNSNSSSNPKTPGRLQKGRAVEKDLKSHSFLVKMVEAFKDAQSRISKVTDDADHTGDTAGSGNLQDEHHSSRLAVGSDTSIATEEDWWPTRWHPVQLVLDAKLQVNSSLASSSAELSHPLPFKCYELESCSCSLAPALTSCSPL